MDRERIERRRAEYAEERERLRMAYARLDGAIVALDQLLAEEAKEDGQPSEGDDDGSLGGNPG